MRKYLQKLFLLLFLSWILNVIIGLYIESKNTSKVWQDFYNQDSIEIFITGSSHAAFGINPCIIDSLTDLNSFNLSSPAQSPKTAYVIVEEAIRKYKPKYIFQELFFYTFYVDNQFQNQIIPLAKFENAGLVLKIWSTDFNLSEKLQALLPMLYNKKLIVDGYKNFFRLNTQDKSSQDDSVSYYCKGFYGYSNHITEAFTKEKYPLQLKKYNFKDVPAEQIVYLNKMTELCKQNDVKLIWFTTPLPNFMMKEMDYYSRIHQALKNLSLVTNTPYYDFNKKENKIFSDTLDFKDNDHLNLLGANKLTSILISFLNEDNYIDKMRIK